LVVAGMNETITAIIPEILTAAELAAKLKVKVSWVVEASKPGRNHDPIPLIKVGRHNRYAWVSKTMQAWLNRRGLKF
jgi:hypothetical protein